MKKSISLIATSLSVGMLLTSSMVNIPSIQAATVENSASKTSSDDVDENGISEDLKSALVKGEYFDDESDITPTSLSEYDNWGTYIDGQSYVGLSSSKITNISGIQYIKKADRIELGTNDIKDLSPLKDSNVKTLNLHANKSITNWSPLSNMKNLTSLEISNCEISDISPISKMINLKELIIKDNHIMDLTSLRNLKDTTIDLESQQSFFETPINLSENKLSFDLNKYTNPDGTVSEVGLTYSIDGNGDENGDVAIDNSTGKIDVTNISGSGTLASGFNENFEFNGTNYKLNKVVFQDYTIGGVKTKSVTMKVGDKWNDGLGFVQAIDTSGNKLEVSDFDVDTSELDTSKVGKYEVTYTAKDNPEITSTADVTVENKSGGGNNSGSNTGDVTEIDEMLLTSKKTDSITIYDENGNKISDKTLDGVTDFTTTKKSDVDGVTYYQVSDNEWVKESDVSEYFEYSGTVQTNSDSIKKLSNLNGDSSNRGLAKTSDWQADRYSYINGNKSYRVSTNEWVAADQTLEITPVRGVLTINSKAQLYRDNGQKSDRGLAENSTFVTDKTAMINGETMYRVSTNEWVAASQVTLN
ncbi:SLAP domain-containing protein [Companilactobacillus keshanensis]|uniref:SLAP domain-containing protein n=1 Tax=Companilactobacillus keshanensis TaxID=2486003 RepID=A0ABW4BSF2_9LACO|nr:leucine-rich repeat domain-containing protein [Companilactobacillus keshanensis]